jgi:hypothetical protein
MECWNPGDMDVSGGILANLDAGYPCRHDDDLRSVSSQTRFVENEI